MSRAAAAAVEPEALKRSVAEWWNARPCGSTVSGAEFASREFFDEVERHRYEQEPHISKLVDFPRWRGCKVLEVGCGMGTDLLQFARAGAEVTGVDLTPRAIEITSEHLRVYGYSGELRTADAEHLPFASDSFDVVYSHGVLHHTPHTAAAIVEVHRVLKPGGAAMVMLYHKNSLNYRFNIRVLRRLAFGLLRRGVTPERLSALTGVDRELLGQYVTAVRAQGGWGRQQLLNNNTDGPGNPLSQVFSRTEAKRMFQQFSSVRTEVHWLVSKNIPLLGRLLPQAVDRAVGRVAGWDLHIIAVK